MSNTAEELRIGILANRSLRNGPGSPLIRFLREFETYFREVSKARIYTLEGTYRAILRNGLFHDYEDLYSILPGYAGGIVTLTSMVVKRRPQDIDSPPLDVIIYLIDPRDPTSLYPESLALKRECVVAERTFIPTYSGAHEWASLRWHIACFSNCEGPFLDNELAQAILDSSGVDEIEKPIAEQTIALIAHDEMKTEMLRFARENFDALLKFKRRVATGTTGTLLNGEEPERLPIKKMDKELKAQFRSLKKELAKRRLSEPWIDAQPSGPYGGDVRIADEVLNKQCQKVIFFEDPHVSRPHEADIQLLERTSRIPGRDIMCLHDFRSAEEWSKNRRKCAELGIEEPLLISRAFRILFNVDLVLANDRVSEHRLAEDDLWRKILRRAAWFIMNLIISTAKSKRPKARPATVAITWGWAMHELVEEIEKLPGLLQKEDDRLARERETGRLRKLDSPLADEHYVRPGNLQVIPMVGIMGTTDPRVEANKNALRLAEHFDGKTQSLPGGAFIDADASEGMDASRLDWDEVDVAVFTGDRVKENFGIRAVAPMPPLLYDQMKKAAGEVGGLFLNRDGNEIPPTDYVRLGMRHEELARVAGLGGSVLIAGVQEKRIRPALAALRGHLAATLVTDFEFASKLLKTHLEIG